MTLQTKLTTAASVALRTCAFLFFRLFPAHFPTIILGLFVVYLSSFFTALFPANDLDIILEPEVDVTIEATAVTVETPLLADDDLAEGATTTVVAEKIEVKEEVVVVEEKPVQPWKVLLLGSPCGKRPLLTLVSFLFNLLLLAFTADALYRARLYHRAEDLSFVRLGYVSSTEAKFVIREPDQAKMPVTLEFHVKNAQAPLDNTAWQTVGGIRWTENATDFTASLTVPLKHTRQKVLEWRSSNNHSGEFLIAPRPGAVTEHHDGKFTFLSTSCILPRFPYNPLDHPLAIPGLRHLAKRLPELGAQFMLFLGDFIYVDVPQRFGKTVEEYRMQYRQVYASPDWTAVSQNLSWIHVLDDHEISNDWSDKQTGVYEAAIDPWHNYQAKANPTQSKAGNSQSVRLSATWYQFEQGPASFFMMDTRSYRSSNSIAFNDTAKTMLGDRQLTDLLAWLARPEPKGVHWKVIASSVPFTKNWPINVQDTWGGFLVERQKILEAMWDAGAKGTGVLVLSGDRHEFAATKFAPPAESRWPQSAAAHEFSTSPLNQFASPFPTYKQTDDEDVMIKYIPGGMSKFGSFTMETVDGKPTMLYRLFIDGKEAWSTVVEAPSTPVSGSGAPSFWDRIKFA